MTLSKSKTRLRFDYDVFRKGETSVLVEGHVTLCFYNQATKKPMRAPESVVTVITSLNETELS